MKLGDDVFIHGFVIQGFGNRVCRKASTFAMAAMTATMITMAKSHWVRVLIVFKG